MLEQQLALLGRLAEAGLEIAVALERQAKGETDVDVARGDIALRLRPGCASTRRGLRLRAVPRRSPRRLCVQLLRRDGCLHTLSGPFLGFAGACRAGDS